MIIISWLTKIFNRKDDNLNFSIDWDDLDFFKQDSKRIHMKRLAIETCISFLGRTISQSEFKVRDGKVFVKDELYYKLNLRPNKNMTASTFWETVIFKLIYDNECLIVLSDDGDLLIADDFEHNSYAVFEDTFVNVVVKDFRFKRAFRQNEVLHLRYRNQKLAPLIDGLFKDYGELFGRVLNSQMRKNQVRGTVNMDMISAKTERAQQELQDFINRMYKAIEENEVAVVPEQKGIEYKEHYSGSSASQQSVKEINEVTNGFLNQVAMAIGIPPDLIVGEKADIEKQTKNYMSFTIGPLVDKMQDEVNSKFFTPKEFLSGKRVDIRKVSYQSIFDLATSIDKLVSSSAFTPNELRDEAGHERSDDPMLDKHYLTKNYSEAFEGGDGD